MGLSKLREEAEQLAPSYYGIAFSDVAGAPEVPSASPRAPTAKPRRRQMAMRFGVQPQPLPQAPTPPTERPIFFTSQLPSVKAPPATTPSSAPQFQSLPVPTTPISAAFSSLPPQSKVKLTKPAEPYLPTPQSFASPPVDRSEIEKMLYGQPQQRNPLDEPGLVPPPPSPIPKNPGQQKQETQARIITDMGYPPIDEIEDIIDIDQIYNMRDELENDIRIQTGKLVGLQNKKNKTKKRRK